MAEMPVRDQVMVMAVHTRAEVVLAAMRTAARIWWAIHKKNGAKGSLVFVVPDCYVLSSDWRGSRTDSGSQDGAVYNPPEVLTLEPKLLVNPDVVVGPIKDGDSSFDIVCGGRRHSYVVGLLKRSPSA